MLLRAQRLTSLARAAAPLRRFAAPALRHSDDGATACCARGAAPGEPPAFGVFASRATLRALGGAAGFVDLPPLHAQLAQGRAFAMLESTAGRVVLAAPLSGEVLRRNEALLEQLATGPGVAPPPAGAQPEPLWLLDLACEDETEWEALPPAAAHDGAPPA
jgi:glycine cleavage system H lipoate-binding protein